MRMFKRFFGVMRPFWKTLALALSLNGASAGFALLTPYVTKLIIDKAYLGKDFRLFIILAGVMGLLFIMEVACKGLNNYWVTFVELRVGLQLNKKMFQKFQNFPYRFFQDSSTGENLYKFGHDVEQAARLMVEIVPQVIVLVPRSIFILAIILFLNSKMFFLVLAMVPFLYVVPYYFSQVLRKVWKIWVENSQNIFKRLQETLSHMYVIKAYGKERQETRSYIKEVIQNLRVRLKNTKLESTAFFLNGAIQKAILGLILLYGGYQVIKGYMTLGNLSAISIYLGQLSGIQGVFAKYIQQIPSGLVSCERLDRLLELPAERTEAADAKETEFRSGKIEFKDVTFAYEPDREVLKGISFSIESGSCVALTGPSGLGKTTLINLLLRLYQPSSGQIFVDGKDIAHIQRRSLHDQVTIVLQEPYLWNDTVENNIRYGKEDACFEEIAAAAQMACIDRMINDLPGKYKTVIGENACRISEGQKQRIAIARALIRKPRVLVLDEAFSSLDSEAERKIMENMRRSLVGSTLIVISHRLSTIEKADFVYFLEGRDKIDTGTHHEILLKNPRYKDYLSYQQSIM